jgi:hypothetical protein
MIQNFKFFQIYEKFPRLDKQWTPIERTIVKIQIGNNLFHPIMKIEFPI